MPGVVDAVTAARVRLEHAERLLVQHLSFVEDEELRALPSEVVDWRAVIEQAIRSLQEAIQALQLALEQP